MKILSQSGHSAARYLVRVVGRMLLMIWIVATITFLAVRALPGNPVDIFIQDLVQSGIPFAEAQQRASALLRLNLDAPLHEQYLAYLANLVRGDLGESYVIARGQDVTAIIAARLPWTLFSVGVSLAMAYWIGVRVGLLAAYRRGSRFDHFVTNTAAVLDSIPAVLMAVIAVMLLGVVWRLVPVAAMRGAYSPGITPSLSLDFVVDALAHVAVPGAVYILSSIGAWILAMRSSTLGVLGDDYITIARARGLSEQRIRSAYVGRNARLPLVTAFAIALGFTVGGSILIEQIFVYPGVGLTLGQAVDRRDYPVMQGILIVTTLCVLVAVAVADAIAGWLDPRIRVPVEMR